MVGKRGSAPSRKAKAMKAAGEKLRESLVSFVADYRRRFAPALFSRILRNDLQSLPRTLEVPVSELDSQLKNALECLADAVPNISFGRGISDEERQKAAGALREHFGFHLQRAPSTLPVGGTGVFVRDGVVPARRLVAMYPGTVYAPGDSLLFQSIGNSFVLRCLDGVTVDGNDRRLSRAVFLSCARRDLSPELLPDTTWLSAEPLNFLTIGQYVNDANESTAQNVQYMELDILGWPMRLRKFLPYVEHSPSPNRLLRVVLLVSTRNINADEELFSAYVSRS